MNRGHEHGYKREEREHSSNIGSTGVDQLFIISAEKYIWISIPLNWVKSLNIFNLNDKFKNSVRRREILKSHWDYKICKAK